MKMSGFGKCGIAAGFGLSVGLSGAKEMSVVSEKPNIIYVFADQMRAQSLGCYGNTTVPTPNIDAMASNRMSLKQMPFEEAIRVPFVMEYPGVVPAGSRTDALLAPVDIMPTLLSLAGVPCPAVDGKDLADAARGRVFEAQDAVLITQMVGGDNSGPYIDNAITPWHGVRTTRYTYVNLHGHGPWLLYDNEKDPYQLENLVEVPEYAELVAALERRMRELMAEAGHPGDPQKVAQFMDSRRLK